MGLAPASRNYGCEVHLAGSFAVHQAHNTVPDLSVDAGSVFSAETKIVGYEDVFLSASNLLVSTNHFPVIRHNERPFQCDQLWFRITNEVTESGICRDKVPAFGVKQVCRDADHIKELTKCRLQTLGHDTPNLSKTILQYVSSLICHLEQRSAGLPDQLGCSLGGEPKLALRPHACQAD